MANRVACLNLNKLLGKNLMRKYPPNFFFTWIIFITHGEWNINILWTNQHRISHSGIFLPFLSKFGPKNQNCLFKMKFVIYTNSNKWKYYGGVPLLFCFRPGIPFFAQFIHKIQNYLFNVKFGTLTNSNKQNSRVILTFTVLD